MNLEHPVVGGAHPPSGCQLSPALAHLHLPALRWPLASLAARSTEQALNTVRSFLPLIYDAHTLYLPCTAHLPAADPFMVAVTRVCGIASGVAVMLLMSVLVLPKSASVESLRT